MKHAWVKNLIWLLLAFYLLGGHAGAHGLAWCLGADGHGHVEAADCASDREGSTHTTGAVCLESPGTATDSPHTGAECRHLPVSTPHASGVAQAPKVEAGTAAVAIGTILNPSLRLASARSRESLSPPLAQLPRTVALMALRSIVLLN